MIDEENQLDSSQDSTSESATRAADASEAVVNAPEASTPIGDTTCEPNDLGSQADNEETGSVATDAHSAAELQAAMAQMESEQQTLKAQLEDRTSQYMRLAADFDNFRKRTLREKEELEQQIKCATIIELLPVVDNFERARAQIKPQTESEGVIHKSYQSVYKQLVDCLKRVGVAPMRAEGKEFDPNLHEAVMREASNEPEGTVLEELQRGYMLGERVLRHALVKVAAPPEPDASAAESESITSDE